MEALALATQVAAFLSSVLGKRNDTLEKLAIDAAQSLERILAVAERERSGNLNDDDLKSLQVERHAAEQRRREAVEAAIENQ